MRTSRRSFLHGMGGAVLALPWLESLGGAAVNTVPALRAAWFYVPIGEADAAIPQFSSNREALPNTARLPVGLLPLELTPTMKPLAKVKDKVTLITGMDHLSAWYRRARPMRLVFSDQCQCF